MIKFTILISFVMLAVTAFAQTNFSGNWEIEKSKSTLNQDFSMAPAKIVITQDGNAMNVAKYINFQGNEMTLESKYTLDGIECVNDGMQGTKIKSTVKVADDKKSLTILTKIPMQDGAEMSLEETYQMAEADLTVQSKAISSWGTVEEKWVLVKK